MLLTSAIAWFVLMTSQVASGAQTAKAGCSVDFGVYSEEGNRLPFQIVRVRTGGHDLLNRIVDDVEIRSEGSRLIFSSPSMVGKRPLVVTLKSGAGAQLETEVFVSTCNQRRSLTFRTGETESDVSAIEVRGRVVGCPLTGDWWVSAVTMFGESQPWPRAEARVARDGTFQLGLPTLGGRWAILVGNGGTPLTVVGADIEAGRVHDIGSINLGGRCSP